MPDESEFEATTSRKHTAVMAGDVSADLRWALDHMPDAVLLMDRKWRFVYVNERGRRISRLLPEHMNSVTHWELFPETVGTEIETKYRRVMEQRVEERLEFYYEPFDTWFRIRVLPAPVGIQLVYEDFNELRSAREAVAGSLRQLQELFGSMTDGVAALNREWRFTFLNPSGRRILAGAGELMGESLWHRFPEVTYEGSPVVASMYRAMHQREPVILDAYYPAPLDRWFHVECQPSADGVLLFFRDVTQAKLDAEELRASGERFRMLTDLNPQAIWTGTPEGVVDYANDIFLKYLGPSFALGGGSEWLAGFDPADHARVVDAWTHSLGTGERYCIEARMIRGRDGASRWWRVEASPVHGEDGAITAWIGTGLDIDDQRMATEALQTEKAETERQRAELEAVYQTAPVGLALFEPEEFRYLRVNQRQSEVLGFKPEEIVGKRIEELIVSPVVPNLFREKVLKGEVIRDFLYETEMRAKPGEVRSFNVNYSPVLDEEGHVRAISAAILEITTLRKAERALLQSEKLAAVGRLASSISHEINNPLEAVTNLLYLIATDDALPDSLKTFVHQAQDELARVSQIATQTLRFHRQSNKPTHVTPAQLVDGVLNLFAGRLANSGIAVEAAYSTTKQVLCFENDIRQVLNNLIANAIDAMRTGGRLLVRAHDSTMPDGADGVRITVCDTGSGMTAETSKRLFEPFYTTKDLNGTGLGLWISKEIVERHRGRLAVRSTQDARLHGTIFTLLLPCAQSAMARAD